ncbi:hypothetical protein ACXRSW_21825, partial [Aeromonas dhakensis]|uniref:hypothetical protein n=1 Tax=Aeromonas dhakensis TaxID=196024 RepID=UPI0020B4027B
ISAQNPVLFPLCLLRNGQCHVDFVWLHLGFIWGISPALGQHFSPSTASQFPDGATIWPFFLLMITIALAGDDKGCVIFRL